MRPKTESRPVLLTKVEAMEFAADRLISMAHDLEMAKVLLDAFEKNPAAEVSAQLAELRREMPEPALQAAACRQGARAIRDQALEERLVDARVAAAASVRSGGGDACLT